MPERLNAERLNAERLNAGLPLLWRLLEAWFHHAYKIEVLEDDPECLLGYNLYRHSGAVLRLAGGEVVKPGDTVLELHFRREALLPLMREGDSARLGVGLMKLGNRDMPRLARALRDDPRFAQVKALHAITMFHRGIAKWGFEVQPLPPREEWWFSHWQRLLMARDHPLGARHVREHREKLVAKQIWASRGVIIRQYCPSVERSSDPGPRPDLQHPPSRIPDPGG